MSRCCITTWHYATRVSFLNLLFEIVYLDELEQNKPATCNITSTYHVGLIGDGGKWGQIFVDFMLSDLVMRIYAEHGLRKLS